MNFISRKNYSAISPIVNFVFFH